MDKEQSQNIIDRRQGPRVSCHTPLMFKICRDETISKIMEGYTQDLSSGGLRCRIPQQVSVGSTLWLKLTRDALIFCEETEKNAVILQQGILGKVVWVTNHADNDYDVGLQFITRQEKVSQHIPPA